MRADSDHLATDSLPGARGTLGLAILLTISVTFVGLRTATPTVTYLVALALHDAFGCK
jgi:hypothetical protein